MSSREDAFEATLACVAEGGLKGFTVEDVARRAGVSRATIYRTFPGGRDQLVAETVTWEVGRFFTRLAGAVAAAPDFRTRVELGLAHAHRELAEHAAFQQAMATDSGELLSRLSETGPMVVAVIRAYLEPLLAEEDLVDGVTAAEAADHLARLIGSFIVDEGDWDLGDPDDRRDLVDRWLLAGVLAP